MFLDDFDVSILKKKYFNTFLIKKNTFKKTSCIYITIPNTHLILKTKKIIELSTYTSHSCCFEKYKHIQIKKIIITAPSYYFCNMYCNPTIKIRINKNFSPWIDL
jgi:hypothetical protein